MVTEFVTGLPDQFDAQPEEFFHAGGLDMVNASEGCCELVYGNTSLIERHVAVEGVGDLGENVVRCLVDRGAEVTITNVSADCVDALADQLG